MRQFYLSTPYGDSYYIHDNGNIERTDLKDFQVSGQWKFDGLAFTNGFAFGKRADVTLADLADGNTPATYKNGAPRYTVIDFDHGSMRVWGNTSHHGVKSVRRVTEMEAHGENN